MSKLPNIRILRKQRIVTSYQLFFNTTTILFQLILNFYLMVTVFKLPMSLDFLNIFNNSIRMASAAWKPYHDSNVIVALSPHRAEQRLNSRESRRGNSLA